MRVVSAMRMGPRMASERILLAAMLLLFYNGPKTRALKNVVITGGGAVRSGNKVTLRCSYDLEGAQLYSIKWYRNLDEFYRFVPKESPPMLVFSLPGVHVDLSASNDERVTLTSIHRQLAGLYACEVSADAPLFHTEIQSTRLEVVDVPEFKPSLTVDRFRLSAGDSIRANCSSPLSYPPANLTWFLNDTELHNTHTMVLPASPDMWTASSSFSVIEIATEEQAVQPKYTVGGSQQETSSSQLKIPNSIPEMTVFTMPSNNYDNGADNQLFEYPLRLSPVPVKVTRITMKPGFGDRLKLKCEATIYDVYRVSSEVVKIREETPNIASVMEQSSAGYVHRRIGLIMLCIIIQELFRS